MAIFKEIINKSDKSLYFAEALPGDEMVFPLHYHDDYELTLSFCRHAKRVIGTITEEFFGCDLVLIGPGVTHAFRKIDKDETADLYVIQFSRALEDFQIFATDILRPISKMLKNSEGSGLGFTQETATLVRDRIKRLTADSGIEGVLNFISILYTLSTSEGVRQLGKPSSGHGEKRIDTILNYINNYYSRQMTLEELGSLVNLSREAFCRYFKSMTGKNFSSYVAGVRIKKAAESLVETDKTIAEIAYSCGFNNLSNFHRTFKEMMGTTPTNYRHQYLSI